MSLNDRIDELKGVVGCFWFIISFIYVPPFSLVLYLYLLIFTNGVTFYLTVIYTLWYVYDFKTPYEGGRSSMWVCEWTIWKWMASYFPVRLHKTVDLDPNENYLFAQHPHGMFVYGGFSVFAVMQGGFQTVFKHFKSHLLLLNGHFLFPFYREYLMCGNAGSSSKETIVHRMTKLGKGNIVWLAIGGASEAEFCSAEIPTTILLSRRKGFIRISLQNGFNVVPVFSFGESECHTQTMLDENSMVEKFRMFFRRWVGVKPPIAHGRLNLGIFIVPFRVPINIVSGKPIAFPRIENPSVEDVDKYHRLYIEKLTELYNSQKERFGYGDRDLVII